MKILTDRRNTLSVFLHTYAKLEEAGETMGQRGASYHDAD